MRRQLSQTSRVMEARHSPWPVSHIFLPSTTTTIAPNLPRRYKSSSPLLCPQSFATRNKLCYIMMQQQQKPFLPSFLLWLCYHLRRNHQGKTRKSSKICWETYKSVEDVVVAAGWERGRGERCELDATVQLCRCGEHSDANFGRIGSVHACGGSWSNNNNNRRADTKG